jgi:hypothetical protein
LATSVAESTHAPLQFFCVPQSVTGVWQAQSSKGTESARIRRIGHTSGDGLGSGDRHRGKAITVRLTAEEIDRPICRMRDR